MSNADLVVDNIVKLEGLSKYLHDEKSNEVVDLTNLDPEELPNYRTKWKVNIEDSRQCTDLLAKEIMYLWDDVDESFDADDWETINNTKTADMSYESKVSRWFESTQVEIDEDVEMDDKFSPEMASTQAPNLEVSVMKKRSRIAGF